MYSMSSQILGQSESNDAMFECMPPESALHCILCDGMD